MKVKVKLHDDYRQDAYLVPSKATPGAAGFDLKAAEATTIYPKCKGTVRTGIHLEIEEGYEGQVRSRSGIAKKNGTFVLNSPGTIDSDFRGEVMVILQNLGEVPLSVNKGDRIAQLVICQLPAVSLELAHELSSTARGEGGFGSTGTK